ncbi:hypothetical protein ACFQ0D_17290, partial [Micromonospora zhanjiangensis]
MPLHLGHRASPAAGIDLVGRHVGTPIIAVGAADGSGAAGGRGAFDATPRARTVAAAQRNYRSSNLSPGVFVGLPVVMRGLRGLAGPA